MSNTDIPVWEKYTLTIEETSKYFRIGEKKLPQAGRGRSRSLLAYDEGQPYPDQEKAV